MLSECTGMRRVCCGTAFRKQRPHETKQSRSTAQQGATGECRAFVEADEAVLQNSRFARGRRIMVRTEAGRQSVSTGVWMQAQLGTRYTILTKGANELRLFDRVDAEVGLEVEIKVEHLLWVAGLLRDNGQDLLPDFILARWRCSRHGNCRFGLRFRRELLRRDRRFCRFVRRW